MKKLILSIVALSGLLSFAADPTVSNVKMRQRYPWNALVDIDYEISGDLEGVSVSFVVNDKQNDKTYQPTKFISAPTAVAGKNRATWDTAAEGVDIISSNVFVTVSLLKAASPATADKLYMVIDLSGGTAASSYPVSYLSAAPDGGWTDEYKTTKLVLRRIEAGTFMIGNGTMSATITKPFYIGVFQMTQKQYALITGSNPSYFKGDMRPVEFVSYPMVRGTSEGCRWPATAGIDNSSFLGVFRARTGIGTFDLPTGAQWEYACRAGTTSAYNNGGDAEDDLKQLGRYAGNQNDGCGGYSGEGTTTVGSYLPNGWGLYDMHGNVWELCLDWAGDGSANIGGVDPKGAETGTHRAMCGGAWAFGAQDCVSSNRGGHNPSHGGNNFTGFRLCCAAGE